MQYLSSMGLYDLTKERLNETILTAQETVSGNLKTPERVMSYPLFPPVGCIRADLQQGTMKLLYGESADVSYIALNDFEDGEILLIMNGHVEDGVPVDWWIVGPDDDLLERRHLKLGHKLKDIPKKIKNMSKAGFKIADVLKDVRNERTPQWAGAFYADCQVWSSASLNVVVEPSSWEAFQNIYIGIAAKQKYGLPDPWMWYTPWPPMIATIIAMGMNGWNMKINGLFCGHHLYLIGMEEFFQEKLKTEFPEFYEKGFVSHTTEVGIPRPLQTLMAKSPNIKKKETYEKELFDWDYPPGWIRLEDLNLTHQEMLQGALLDVTHETPLNEPVTESNIISKGIGLNTKFL